MSLKSKRAFVVQKHLARKAGLHYDFRLEMPTKKGTKLVSWVIRKGPSLDPSVKRLALQTTDHDISYGTFEGITADGAYGAGKTIIWDKGKYKILTKSVKTKEDLKKVDYFKFELYGKKLKGVFVLFKTKRGWILKKIKDGFAKERSNVTKELSKSVISNKDVT